MKTAPNPASADHIDTGTFVAGLNQALRDALDTDPSVLVLGEDVAALGGLFRVTEGLAVAHPDRVFDTPIAEAGFTGMAIGAAMAGQRVVVEMQVIDFLWLAADQLANAGHMHYISGGQVSVPIVVRGPCGFGTGFGATHSQHLEAVFAGRPGLKVVMPSTPADAKGLLTSAIRDPGPVIVFEDSVLYYQSGSLPPDGTSTPLGSGAVVRKGRDCSLVSAGRGVGICLKAAQALRKDHEIDVEVIDLRSLQPVDWQLLERSVRNTGRFAIALDGPGFCSYGSYIASEISRRCWDELVAPPTAVGGLDVPGTVTEAAERFAGITIESVARAVAELATRRTRRAEL